MFWNFGVLETWGEAKTKGVMVAVDCLCRGGKSSNDDVPAILATCDNGTNEHGLKTPEFIENYREQKGDLFFCCACTKPFWKQLLVIS